MPVSSSLVKELLYGKNIAPSTPATFLSMCELHKQGIRPEEFRPLIPITGGSSVVGGDAFGVLLFCGDWIRLCEDAGSDPKNAIICLASNYDDHQGMVALALEAAMMANKKSRHGPPLMSDKDFLAVAMEVFGKNYAGIHAMCKAWGVGVGPKAAELGLPVTRTTWRGRLGHDVLIHPVTLEPCCDEDGGFLKYEGLIIDGEGEARKDAFKFTRKDGSELITSEFPKGAGS